MQHYAMISQADDAIGNGSKSSKRHGIRMRNHVMTQIMAMQPAAMV